MSSLLDAPAPSNPPTATDAAALVQMIREVVQNSATTFAVMEELRGLVDPEKLDRLVSDKVNRSTPPAARPQAPSPRPFDVEPPAVLDVMRPPADASEAVIEACHKIRAFIQTLSGWEVEEDALAAITAVGLLERTAEAARPGRSRPGVKSPRDATPHAEEFEGIERPGEEDEDDDDDDAPGTRTYHVYYVGESDFRRSARLEIFADDIGEGVHRQELYSPYDETEKVGTLSVDEHALRFEIEAEAMAAFGSHVGDCGRPAFARFCSPSEWERIVGEVAVMLLTWPRYAPQTPDGLDTDPGPATAEAIAAATGRSLLDVRDAIAELRRVPLG